MLNMLFSVPAKAGETELVKNFDDAIRAWSNRPDSHISYVYVSEVMMKLISKKNILTNIPGINAKALVDKLSTIQIVTVPGLYQSEIRQVKNLVMSLTVYSDSNQFESLLSIEENGVNTELFFGKKKSKSPAALIMTTKSASQYSVVLFTGDFTIDNVLNVLDMDTMNKSAYIDETLPQDVVIGPLASLAYCMSF